MPEFHPLLKITSQNTKYLSKIIDFFCAAGLPIITAQDAVNR
jgi:hypothetical protein